MSSCENLNHYEPTTRQYEKLNSINEMSEECWTENCCLVNDCSICDMAIHQFLLSTTKHVCVRGMTKEQLEVALDNADCDF